MSPSVSSETPPRFSGYHCAILLGQIFLSILRSRSVSCQASGIKAEWHSLRTQRLTISPLLILHSRGPVTPKFDHSRIAAAGHSCGAQTTGMLVGARMLGPDGSLGADMSDPRLTVGVLLCAGGRGGKWLVTAHSAGRASASGTG